MIRSFLCAAALGWVAFGSAASAATIAVGYAYSVTDARFTAITAPSFGAVGDVDGYTITVLGVDYSFAAGAVFDVFSMTGLSSTTTFSITGIDPSLELDPDNPLAFPIGVSFILDPGPPILSITPITITTPAPVPLPASLPLLGMAAIALGGLSARRRRQPQA